MSSYVHLSFQSPSSNQRHNSGYSFLEGDSLFIYNLSNGIDLYSLRTMQRLRHYESPVTINVPLQVALTRQSSDQVVVGGVDGIVRIYDRETSGSVYRLEHKVKGQVQVIDVSILRICVP